jgi:predicted Zn-dependent protease
VIYFNNKRLIDHVEISITKIFNGSALNQTMLERIIKHEIGHSFGLGH